jgi:uncharacterized protein YqeY
MSLYQKITDDLKIVMKAGREFETGVLRMLLASLHNKEIEKRGKGLEPALSDDDVIEVLTREAKKRKEAAELYAQGKRNDLAEKETKEWSIIKKYLPEQLSQSEVEKIIDAAMEKTGATSVKEFGLVMKEVMKELSAQGGSASGGKGRADAKMVGEIVKNKLQ